jgi:hypothetical protein
MLNTHKLKRIAITTAALVALCATQLIAHAETVSITGDIQGETCVLSSLLDGKFVSKNFTLPLGTFDLTLPSATAAAGDVFGTQKIFKFFLLDAASTKENFGVCNFSNGASGWDISIAPAKSGYITTINGATFLSNMVSLADGGTNAVVKLTGGLTNPPLNAITLTEAGSYVSSPTEPFLAISDFESTIFLGVQFAQPVANQKPISGVYSSTLTFAVTYR